MRKHVFPVFLTLFVWMSALLVGTGSSQKALPLSVTLEFNHPMVFFGVSGFVGRWELKAAGSGKRACVWYM